ncbi:MAG: toxic anion resistance protein [Lachnospiraceae bacterium]|nr:toxic anion resistance protein [Lachnospiraceae bacterium]
MSNQILDVKDIPAPTLTLAPMDMDALTKAQGEIVAAADAPLTTTPQAVAEQALDDSSFTEEEKKQIEDFAKQIDLTNSNLVLQYGAGSQKKMADFSETALENVRTKDLGEVGNMLVSVVTELKSFDAEEESKGLFGFFKKTGDRLTSLKAKYDRAEVNVNKISGVLEGHQITLLKDVAILDKMYELNKTYFKEISMYLLAGKKRLAQVRSEDLAALREKAAKSGLAEDAQEVRDLDNLCTRFEKKLYDLELTRQISLQTAPQIRLIQNNDTVMVEKIQSIIVNTIPLWKSQMVLALGIAHSTDAAKASRQVTDMTNELLKKNAATLKTATIETARESERGIVDIETLVQTNQSLISTLDEVMKIQQDGHAKRQAAEAQMHQMEAQLKTKLLELSQK